jgi:UDP-glucuronate decarboxylase
MRNLILNEDLDKIHKKIIRRVDWNNSTIVITGCAGFLGFYLTQYFVRRGKELGIKKVIGLDNFCLGQPDWLNSLAKEFPSLLFLKKFDVSIDDISKIKDIADTNYFIHAASIASPSFYRKFPVQTIDANVFGLRKLLDYYKNSSKLKGFLFFSSSEIYGDPDLKNIPTDEDYFGNVNCVGPRACYDESKRYGETLCWVFAKHYQMPIIIARPFNNYGPGMRLEDKRLPADLANNIISGKDIFIFSDGKPKRTFCYVSDAIIGYLLCLTYGTYDYFNIGIDKPEISVSEFAEVFRNAGMHNFNYKGSIKYKISEDQEYMTNNPNRRCPVIDKAKIKLGYDPTTTIEEGVDRYLKFLRYTITR